ncbi:MAG: hypothetical protein GWP03_03620 [Proteobacteria bacterium]|nr:hypothetical protein [Pseudomonadota bacterium]
MLELPFIIGFAFAFFQILKLYLHFNPEILFFLSGMFFYIILRLSVEGFTDHSFRFLDNFEHELTHIFFSVICFKSVNKLTVTRQSGGSVEVSGDNLLIRLSPYFFPLLAFIVLIPYPFLQIGYRKYDLLLVGIGVGIHLISTIKDIHVEQPDLARSGFVFSIIFVTLMNLIFLGILFAVPVGADHIWDFLLTGITSPFSIL